MFVKKTWFAAQISITRNVDACAHQKHLSKVHYVHIFVRGKHCSPIFKNVMSRYLSHKNFLELCCIGHQVSYGNLCFWVHSLLGLSRRPCLPAAETLLPCARNVHDPKSIPKMHKHEQVKRIQAG